MLKKFLIAAAAGLLLAACQQQPQMASPPPATQLKQLFVVYFNTGQSNLSPTRRRRLPSPPQPSGRAAPLWP